MVMHMVGWKGILWKEHRNVFCASQKACTLPDIHWFLQLLLVNQSCSAPLLDMPIARFYSPLPACYKGASYNDLSCFICYIFRIHTHMNPFQFHIKQLLFWLSIIDKTIWGRVIFFPLHSWWSFLWWGILGFAHSNQFSGSPDMSNTTCTHC